MVVDVLVVVVIGNEIEKETQLGIEMKTPGPTIED